jgi:hypothetical protein
MNLSELIDAGGVISSALAEKKIEWKNPETGAIYKFKIYIKKLPYGDMEKIWGSGDEKSRISLFISQAIRLGDGGKDALSYEMAYQLEPSLARVFIDAAHNINQTGGAKPKNSRPPRKSGTS